MRQAAKAEIYKTVSQGKTTTYWFRIIGRNWDYTMHRPVQTKDYCESKLKEIALALRAFVTDTDWITIDESEAK